MDIWAVRRGQIYRRYGKWLTIALSASVLGAYLYDPRHEAWSAIGGALSRGTAPVKSAVVETLASGGAALASTAPSSAGLSSAAISPRNGIAGGKQLPIAGYAESEVRCLALAVYHDGAGEPLEVKQSFAQVAMNRARLHKDSKSLCNIVYFGLGLPHGCVFRATCRKVGAPTPEASPGWIQAMEIATEAVSTDVLVPKLRDATHFHAVTEPRPDWSRQLYKVALMGRYIFYSTQLIDEAADNPSAPAAKPDTEAAPPKPSRPKPVARREQPSGSASGSSDLSSVFSRSN